MEQEITNLENKSNKTPEEEEELDNLKNKLKDLDKKQESPSPTSYLPWIIGGSCLLVFLVAMIIVFTKRKSEK